MVQIAHAFRTTRIHSETHRVVSTLWTCGLDGTGSSLTPLPGLKVLQWNKKNWNPSTGLKRVGFFFPFKKAYTIIRNIGNAKTAFICMLNVKTTHILHARPENQTSNKIAPGVRAFRKSHSQKDLTKEFLYSPPLPLLALSRVSIPWQPFTP